jgi:hypothetical protein
MIAPSCTEVEEVLSAAHLKALLHGPSEISKAYLSRFVSKAVPLISMLLT